VDKPGNSPPLQHHARERLLNSPPYKAFVCAYGPGSICDDVNIYHPKIPYPPFGLLGDIMEESFRVWDADPYFWSEVGDGGGEAPFEVGATMGGILPWGDALNQVTLS
jgi:hypothetical protein